jgi:hypothetical protein
VALFFSRYDTRAEPIATANGAKPPWLISNVGQKVKFAAIILTLMLAVGLFAAEGKGVLYPLTVREEFPVEYQKAASAVIAAIAKEGLAPREYSAAVQSREGGKILEFALWHDTALKQREAPSVRGDPSGKCRTVLYDVKKEAVTKIYGWR